jgi:aspartyl-tRNA(Asn)/glutamyl-tRNA(Gln) amidotransferase subunit B
LVDRSEITTLAGKDVLAAMLAGEGKPTQLVENKGLRSLHDRGALEASVEQVLAAHVGEVHAYRAGKSSLLAFFIGHVMRATRGKADPQLVRQVLTRKLEA